MTRHDKVRTYSLCSMKRNVSKKKSNLHHLTGSSCDLQPSN